MRVRTILGLAVAAALSGPPSAFAHATLLRSDPPNGAVLGNPPSSVRLFFDDEIRAETGMRAIRNGGGSILDGSARVVRGHELVIPLREGLSSGDYTILWRALSDDGHSIAGVTTFAVGVGRASPKPALAAPSEARPLEIVARWLFFAGILAACGGALFRFATPLAADPPWRLLFASFLLVIAGGTTLVEQSSLETRFGVAVGFAVIVATAGAAITAVSSRHQRASTAAWFTALLLLPIPTVAGHALDSGRTRLELPVDFLHVAASSLWLGGLLCLAVALRDEQADEHLVRRFSLLALISVLILATTGLLRAFGELAGVDQVWSTSYGRLLIAKTAILTILASIGWRNRYRIIPALSRSTSALFRNVVTEITLFVGLVVAVALLTQTRPGRDVAAAAAASVQAPSGVSEGSGGQVLKAWRNGLEIRGRVTSAVALDRKHIVWQSRAAEAEESAVLVERDLVTGQMRIVARNVASQFAIASTPGWLIYATATIPSRLIAVSRDGDRRLVLASQLIAPFEAHDDLVAWAEKDGDRQRVLARNMATGKGSVAADLPACYAGRCYRIDAVTLADQGVVFDRGAIGPQPSFVMRYQFATARTNTVTISHDPQPDLVPSSSGAVYYAFGRGWYRWDFGDGKPRPIALSPSVRPARIDGERWLLVDHRPCRDTLTVKLSSSQRLLIATPARLRALVGVANDLCVGLLNISTVGTRPLTTWLIAPPDSHSEEEMTSVILIGRTS